MNYYNLDGLELTKMLINFNNYVRREEHEHESTDDVRTDAKDESEVCQIRAGESE